jgi:ribonuclease VapC
MIIETSAIVAILFNQDDAQIYAEAISRADSCRVSAATFVETAIVVESQTKNNGSRQLDAFIRRAGIIIEPVTEEQAHIARQAFTDFGKGRHPAGLSYGSTSAADMNLKVIGPMGSVGERKLAPDLHVRRHRCDLGRLYGLSLGR